MAERRMFAKMVIDSDSFLDMPLSTQALYFHLSMRADDDGFVNNPRKIQRMLGATDDDLRLLIAKGYVIPFETGVTVIVHWNIHNTLRKDRYKETIYQEEKAYLQMGKNKEYLLGIPDDNHVATIGIPNGTTDKESLDKDIILKDKEKMHICTGEAEINCEAVSSNKPAATMKKKEGKNPEAIRHKYGEYKNVLLSDEQLQKLQSEFPDDWEARINNLSCYMQSSGKGYKDHLATIRNWARNDKQKKNRGFINGKENATCESESSVRLW